MADNHRSRFSRYLRWALIGLGGLFLLLVVTALVLPRLIPSERIAALVVPRLEAALDREVEIERAGLRVLPLPALRLYDFEVANAEGFGPEPAITGSALDVKLELFPLFWGNVRLRALELVQPAIRYTVDETGRSNFEGIGGAEETPQDTAQAGMLPLAAALSNVRVENALLAYDNRQSNQSAEITFDLATAVVPLPEANNIQSQGTLDLHSGWILRSDSQDTLSVRDVSLAYNLLAEPDRERIAINEFMLDAPPLALEATGTVNELASTPTVDLQIESDEIDLARLNALLGEASASEAGLRGTALVDLQVAGPVTDLNQLTIEGPITLSEVRYPVASLQEPVAIPSAVLRFTGQQLAADEMPIRVGDNTLVLDLKVQDLLAPFAGASGGDALPMATFILTSERLDLRGLYAETDEVGYVDLVVSQLAGQQIEGVDPGVIAAEEYGDLGVLPVAASGQVAIDVLVNESQQLDDLSFQVALKPQQFAVRDISAEMYDGAVAGNLTVNLQQEPPFPVEYTFSLEDISAETFARQWTTLGAFLAGTLDFSLEGQSGFGNDLLPIPPTLQADGLTVATNGHFQDFALMEAVLQRLRVQAEVLTSFERFGGPFAIREGRLLVRGWTLQTGELSGKVEGAVGLDGAVALDIVLAMPLALLQETGLVEEVGGVVERFLGRLADDDEVVRVPIEIGGTMSNPRVQIETDAVETALRQLIRDAGIRIPNIPESR